MSDDNVQVRRGDKGDRFEIVKDGEVAGFTQYFDEGNQRVFFHTEVGEQYGGQGLAGILVKDALDTTRREDLRVVPVCPYVASYVKKHDDEYGDIVDRPTPQILQKLR